MFISIFSFTRNKGKYVCVSEFKIYLKINEINKEKVHSHLSGANRCLNIRSSMLSAWFTDTDLRDNENKM